MQMKLRVHITYIYITYKQFRNQFKAISHLMEIKSIELVSNCLCSCGGGGTSGGSGTGGGGGTSGSGGAGGGGDSSGAG